MCVYAHAYTHFVLNVYRKLEWRNLEVTINGDCTVDVLNIENESKEHLEFSNSIVKASLSWGHLIVITATQMYIFKYVCMYVRTCICMYNMYVCISCTYVCMYVYILVCTCIHVHVCVCVCPVCMYIRTVTSSNLSIGDSYLYLAGHTHISRDQLHLRIKF